MIHPLAVCHKELQEQLKSSLGRMAPVERKIYDGLATYGKWDAAGSPVYHIMPEKEACLLDRPLDPAIAFADAPLQYEARAYYWPADLEWVILARHHPHHSVSIPLSPPVRYTGRALTYMAICSSQYTIGYIGLEDTEAMRLWLDSTPYSPEQSEVFCRIEQAIMLHYCGIQ